MNVYLINEDGVSFCIRAKSMAEAVKICKKSYIDEVAKEVNEDTLDAEAAFYDEQILQSCSLIDELRN